MMLIAKLIDKYLGGPMCNFLSLFKNNEKIDLSKISSILIIQLWGVGETILILPSIEALKKKFPDARIDILCTKRNMDVFFGNKSLSRTILLGQNPLSILKFALMNIKKYDLVIDMEEYLNISAIISFFAGRWVIGYSHSSRARLYTEKVRYNDGQHAVQTFLDLPRKLKADYDTNKLPKLNFSKKDERFIYNFFKKNDIKKEDFVVCVAPGAAESARCRMWPHDRYAELCEEMIIRHNAKIVFVGSPDEIELVNSIQKLMESENKTVNSAGKTTVSQLFCLISKCNLFVGNDAGAMHAAAAQGVKTIGLFGPNIPARFGPYGNENIGLYKGYNCEFSPCINVHIGEVPDCLYPKESNDYQKCMKNISINDVLKEVRKMV